MKELAKRRDNFHARVPPCAGGKGPRGRVAGFQAQLDFSTLPAPPENKSSCQMHLVWGFHSFKTLQAILLSKTQEKDHVRSSLSQMVSSTGRGQQCWSLACPSSEPPPCLQLENLLSAHQGNNPMARSSAFRENLLSH